MESSRISQMPFASIWALLVNRAVRRGRTEEEVAAVACALTGYSGADLQRFSDPDSPMLTYGEFFRRAPALHPARLQLRGSVSGVRLETVEDPLRRTMLCLDWLVDELAGGKSLKALLADLQPVQTEKTDGADGRADDAGTAVYWHCMTPDFFAAPEKRPDVSPACGQDGGGNCLPGKEGEARMETDRTEDVETAVYWRCTNPDCPAAFEECPDVCPECGQDRMEETTGDRLSGMEWVYLSGVAEQKGLPISAMWYAWQAADTGYPLGICRLGLVLEKGIGCPTDLAGAFRMYARAAELGEEVAWYHCGRCLENGLGVEQDPAAALRWYRKAAKAGLPDAMLALGDCYRYGRGVPQSLKRAAMWYSRADGQEKRGRNDRAQP